MFRSYCIVALLGAGVAYGQAIDLLELTRPQRFQSRRSSSTNSDLKSNDDSKRPIPGETLTLADLQGPGVVTHIWITSSNLEYGWPRLFRLRVFYDGSARPSVDVPLGDFFASGHGLERDVQSQMVRVSSNGRSRNSYWPMPFRRSCRITVTNEGTERPASFYYQVEWKKVTSLPEDTRYFHAHYRQAIPAQAGELYELLDLRGRGHYVGTVFSVVQTAAGWFGEGDESFFVDGSREPTLHGTGAEDYFGDAYALHVSAGNYSGTTIADGTGLGSRMTAYRWHLEAPIPFEKSLRFGFEHAGFLLNADGSLRATFEERPDYFSSVAIWYQEGVAAGLPDVPYGSRRLPHGNAAALVAGGLARTAVAKNGSSEFRADVGQGRGMLWFHPTGPDASIEIPFRAPRDGRFEVLLQFARGPQFGRYEVALDGRTLSSLSGRDDEPARPRPVIVDGYAAEFVPAREQVLTWDSLTAGTHRLTLRLVDKAAAAEGSDFGIGAIVLSEVGKVPVEPERARRLRRMGVERQGAVDELRRGLTDADAEVRAAAAWALGQLGTTAGPAATDLARTLRDADPLVRGLAAVGLRDIGPAAGTFAADLIASLKDADSSVRMISAEALGRLRSREATPALVELARRRGEHLHVLRNVVAALGEIGPGAEAAIGALEELKANPRLRYPAGAAQEKIRAVR